MEPSQSVRSLLHAAAVAVVVLVTVAPSLCAGALFPAKTPVVQLTQASFKKEILDIEKPAIVAFTAPWCGHCQRLVPEFHKAAASLDGIVKFANLDCDEDSNKGLCAQHQVQGFPTIKLFPATKKRLARDYRGERSAKALIEYAKDALPMGARKLQPMELESWLNEAPGRPKVILFSDKPKSSALYRSLALDFRSSMNFAHMRGDEPLVRSQGRLVLGVDIPTEKHLPVLLIVKARAKSDDGSWAKLEKGAFETYEGALKYWRIKAWLDEIAPKMGAKKTGKAKTKPASAKDRKSSPKASQKSKPRKEEVLPEGGAVEWKASNPGKPGYGAYEKSASSTEDSADEVDSQGPASTAETSDEPVMDESAPGKDTWRGKMLDIERAGELADQMRAEAAKKGHENRKRFPHLYPSDQNLGTDGFLDKARQAAGSFVDAASQAYHDASERVGEHIDSASRAVTEAAQNAQEHAAGAAEQVMGSASHAAQGLAQTGPFAEKTQALMKQFEKWMGGEAPEGWEENLGDTFARAQADAEALLRRDPEEARRQAWESETWLLREMEGDRARMADVMTTEQRAQVDGMIELIQRRLADKEKVDPFAAGRDSGESLFGDMLKQHTQEQPVVAEEKEAKPAHDEL